MIKNDPIHTISYELHQYMPCNILFLLIQFTLILLFCSLSNMCSGSVIVIVINFLSRIEYVNAHVLFSTLKWPFTYSKKRGLHFFPFIQVLNFWVPERAHVIYSDKKKLYVLKFEYIHSKQLAPYKTLEKHRTSTVQALYKHRTQLLSNNFHKKN